MRRLVPSVVTWPWEEVSARQPAAVISSRVLEDGETTFTTVMPGDDRPPVVVIAPPTTNAAMVLHGQYTFEDVLRDHLVDVVVALLAGDARLSITRGIWKFTQLEVRVGGDAYVAGRRYKRDLESWEERLPAG